MRKSLLTFTVLATLALSSSSAAANFHLMKVTEVFPGTGGNPDSAFIELQAYQAGQNTVVGHSIRTYNAMGANIHTFNLPGNVPNAQSQRTILIGDEFPPNGVAEDFTDTALGTNITAAGGAVCFDAIDCVAWGTVNTAALPADANVGTPAPAIPDGSSLTRSIAAGCATLLEDSDDTNNSAADFSITATESPRNNATMPTEVACAIPPGAEPQTKIDRGPRSKTAKKKATFLFSSPDAGVSFECRIDKKAYKPCASPKVYKRLKKGKHVFSVRAVLDGTRDSSPATYKWRVKKPKKTK